MTTRARRKAILKWFPRGFLIVTTVLAPLIDHHVVPGARHGATRVEAVKGVDPVEAVETVLDPAGTSEHGLC